MIYTPTSAILWTLHYCFEIKWLFCEYSKLYKENYGYIINKQTRTIYKVTIFIKSLQLRLHCPIWINARIYIYNDV